MSYMLTFHFYRSLTTCATISTMNISNHNVTYTTTVFQRQVPDWCIYVSLVYCLVVWIIGVPGNLVILRVMYSVKHKSSTDVFVLCLAISDLMAIVANMPTHLVFDIKRWTHVGPDVLCKIHNFLFVFTFISSELLFTLIGIDRYVKVFRPRCRNVFEKRAVFVSVFVFMLSIFVAVRRGIISELDSFGECQFHSASPTQENNLQSTINLVGIALPVIVICISYLRIGIRLQKVVQPVGISTISDRLVSPKLNVNSYRNLKLLSTSKALACMSFMYLGFTVVSSMIAQCMYLSRLCLTDIGAVITFIFARLYYVNACNNPYIFSHMNSEFNNRVKKMFAKCSICTTSTDSNMHSYS